MTLLEEYKVVQTFPSYQHARRKVLMYGNFGENHVGENLSIAFEQLGWAITRVCFYQGINAHLTNVDLRVAAFLNKTQVDEYKMHIKQIKVKSIVDMFNSQFDFIILLQCDNTFDTTGINLQEMPVYYYYTEALHPYLPMGISACFYGYPGGERVLQSAFPKEFINCKNFIYMPHAVNLPMFAPDLEKEGFTNAAKTHTEKELDAAWDKRSVLFGFRGLEKWPKIGHPIQDGMYILREKYLPIAKELGLVLPLEGTDKQMWANDFAAFMKDTKIALNIPGCIGENWGFINQRMFEACAAKCILLNYVAVGMEDLGFKDGVTCYTFSSEKELREKYKYITEHIEEAKKVALNGFNLVNANHGYISRSLQYLTTHFHLIGK